MRVGWPTAIDSVDCICRDCWRRPDAAQMRAPLQPAGLRSAMNACIAESLRIQAFWLRERGFSFRWRRDNVQPNVADVTPRPLLGLFSISEIAERVLPFGQVLRAFERDVVRLFRPVAVALDLGGDSRRQAQRQDGQRHVLELGIGPLEVERDLGFAARGGSSTSLASALSLKKLGLRLGRRNEDRRRRASAGG